MIKFLQSLVTSPLSQLSDLLVFSFFFFFSVNFARSLSESCLFLRKIIILVSLVFVGIWFLFCWYLLLRLIVFVLLALGSRMPVGCLFGFILISCWRFALLYFVYLAVCVTFSFVFRNLCVCDILVTMIYNTVDNRVSSIQCFRFKSMANVMIQGSLPLPYSPHQTHLFIFFFSWIPVFETYAYNRVGSNSFDENS